MSILREFNYKLNCIKYVERLQKEVIWFGWCNPTVLEAIYPCIQHYSKTSLYWDRISQRTCVVVKKCWFDYLCL